MIYLAAAIVIVAVLVWDGWRRWVAHRAEVERNYGLDDAKSQSIDMKIERVSLCVDSLAQAVESQRLRVGTLENERGNHQKMLARLAEQQDELRNDGRISSLYQSMVNANGRLEALEARSREPKQHIDITDFRAELDKHKRALETLATSTQASVVELKGLIDHANAKSAASLMTGLNSKVKYRT